MVNMLNFLYSSLGVIAFKSMRMENSFEEKCDE